MRWVLVSLLVASPAAAQTTAIVGGTIHTVSGDVVEDGTIVIDEGRITAVGADITVPAGARRIDASGKIVTPGLIDLGTSLGLVEVGSLSDTRDAGLDTDDPIRAGFRVVDGINPSSIVIPVTRLSGVTTVASLPSGGIVSGQAGVLDLGDRDEMIVRDSAAMLVAFNSSAAEAVGGARGELARRLREALADASYYREHRDAFDAGALRKLAASRLDLEALASAIDGDVPFLVRASRAADIDAVLRIAEEHGLDVAIIGAEEAWRRRDVLAASEIPVIAKAYANLPLQFDRLGSRFDNAALLAASGVRVALSTLTTHNARNLRFEAGHAVRHGMPWSEALRAITLTPAEVIGIADTHGSIEPGKAANLVIWSGDPFEPAADAERVLIHGREVERDSRQLRLLERYRSLDGPPVQYLGNPTP